MLRLKLAAVAVAFGNVLVAAVPSTGLAQSPTLTTAIHTTPSLATSIPPQACKAQADATRLDYALPHTAKRLISGEPLQIVAMGSSSTAGAGASAPSASYPSRLEAELRTRFPHVPITVINRGVNGERSNEMLSRFEHDVIEEKPDLVLWQVGSNSVLHD